MSDPNAPTGAHPPDGAQYANTVGWVPPPAGRAPEDVRTVPAASTPGPEEPDQRTDYNTTGAPGAQRPELPRLPPVPGYDVVQFVGRGGMGIVYRAVHLKTGRTVALKLINPSGAEDPTSRERFDREVRALAALKHPNIVPVYDAGEWHGFPYCAMEFAHGGALSAHLDRIRADLRAAVRLMVKVARAVAAMHTAGVLHRDLKPLNVLLGANDEPMVADFGLARRLDDDSDLTCTGLPVGTRMYMAPEQTHGHRGDYTPACDIWGLGVTLYEVLTGQRPFSDDGMTDIYHHIRTSDPPSCALYGPEVPPELEAVARHCLEKRPDDRYRTADEVADDLENWLAGRPVTAPPVPAKVVALQPNAARRGYRRVMLAGIGVLVVVGLGLGFAGAFRQSERPPQRTLAERVAGGERVKLTDETGRPGNDWIAADGHPVAVRVADGYHWFTSGGPGIASFADQPWPLPIRVEADVALRYELKAPLRGGVYVGRRAWPGLPFTHESLVWFGIAPRFDAAQDPKQQLACLTEVYWWERDQYGSVNRQQELRRPWRVDGQQPGPRFARVVMEVRENEVRGTIDGVPMIPIDERRLNQELSSAVRARPAFPPYTFQAPALGTGIGVFVHDGECCVANLTVSMIKP